MAARTGEPPGTQNPNTLYKVGALEARAPEGEPHLVTTFKHNAVDRLSLGTCGLKKLQASTVTNGEPPKALDVQT